jgi:hypothetical protein
VAGFQDPVSTRGIGYRFPPEHNLDAFFNWLKTGGTGVIPDGFLSGAGFDWVGFHLIFSF